MSTQSPRERASVRFDRLSAIPLTPADSDPDIRSGSTFGAIRAVARRGELLNQLVRRDLKSRYKDSALGFAWVMVRPLTQLAIFYVVIGHFLQAAKGIPDFAIYVFTGLTAYTLFSETVQGATGSIVANSGLVKKVYLPREVFPIASVGGALFNFAIQLVILLIATVIALRPPTFAVAPYAALALLVIVVYGLAIGLLLAAVNVYLRDIQYLLDVVVLLLMWASPILYSWQMVRGQLGDGLLLELYTNNPVTLAILGFQRTFWLAGDGQGPEFLLLRLAIALAIGLLLLFGAHKVFIRLQGDFAQAL